MSARYAMSALTALTSQLFQNAGLAADKAHAVADTLVRGEAFGMTTHGLKLLPAYLDEIRQGGMTREGGPHVIQDFAACLTWDGRKLPGPWLIKEAVGKGIARAERYGTATVTIQNSHHTACLSTYLQAATERGFIILIALTDPGHRSVAPFGGTQAVLTSNPIALGAPTRGAPILIDMATSLATNAAVANTLAAGEQFSSAILLDAQGQPSCDPAVISADPPGTILPLGGIEAGHKGYALGLIVEILSGCLGGRGRGEQNQGWSAAVTLTLYSPAAMAGSDAYLKQIEALVQACHDSPPKAGVTRVKLPGERALAALEEASRDGLSLPASLIDTLTRLAAECGLPPPAPLTSH
ncbi:Ldh family oxidoreductase [Paramixta manurensis]|uniref:Ldh family oxidoreductase n=1 Tax=Paramixta manurensis TaxID=2740817 RepID=A0A6M8UBM5_9GAMM|nr:Ldh family oxidoreductase [Erwiniaceae bacterium PD-1]